jgi:thioredoxin-related protein
MNKNKKELADALRIKGVPTLMMYKDGQNGLETIGGN